MECADLAANLTEFLEGELDAEMEAAALEHLSSCEQCELVLAQTRTVVDLSGRHGRVVLEPVAPAEVFGRIQRDGADGV